MDTSTNSTVRCAHPAVSFPTLSLKLPEILFIYLFLLNFTQPFLIVVVFAITSLNIKNSQFIVFNFQFHIYVRIFRSILLEGCQNSQNTMLVQFPVWPWQFSLCWRSRPLIVAEHEKSREYAGGRPGFHPSMPKSMYECIMYSSVIISVLFSYLRSSLIYWVEL
jgi:hypothetical protein